MRKNIKKILGLFALKKIAISFLIFCLLNQEHALHAQALPVAPVANMVMNRALAGVITRTAIARGFAANDPRIAATLIGVSSSISAVNVASTVAGVGLTLLGAPVWLTIAAGLGVFAIGAAVVAGTTQLQLQQGTLKVVAPTVSIPTYPGHGAAGNLAFYTLIQAGVPLYRSPSNCFEGQPCMAFPAIPAGVEFPITVTYASRPAARLPFTYGSVDLEASFHFSGDDGDVVAGFSSISEFASKVALPSPRSPFAEGLYTCPSHNTGVAGQTIVVCNNSQLAAFDTWNWTQPPVLQFSSTGARRIFGKIVTQRVVSCYDPDITDCAGLPYYVANVKTYNYDFISDNTAFLPTYVCANDTACASPVIRSVAISPNFSPSDFADLDTAYLSLSPSQKSAALDPLILAKLADKAWQLAASQPGYQGLPYSASEPLTASDATAYLATNTSPTLNDLLVPASEVGTQNAPVTETVQPINNPSIGNASNVNVVNTPNVNVVNKINVDLGPDPGIGSPSLENIPTGNQILAPIINLLPSLKNYQPPPHVATCPAPSIDLWNQHLVLDGHCTLLDQHSQAIGVVMTLVWSVLALFVMLSS